MGCRNSAESPRPSARSSSRRRRSTQVDIYDPNATDTVSVELETVKNIWKIFEMQKTIGSGASAQVLLVSRRTTKTLYALKSLRRRNIDYFRREFEILRQLDCPHIVKFIGAYRGPGNLYLCMEYCSGDSLLNRLGKRKKYTEGVASSTVKMMLRAIRYLNDMNILHRDIKPENFVYSSESNDALKLLDFGIAMEVQPEKLYRFRVGTSYYLAPEVVLNTEKRTGEMCKKSDIWSIGVCVYIMLNGKVPFMGDDRKNIFDAILSKEVKFKNKGLSDVAMDFVNKLLERDIEKRLTAKEALNHPWIIDRESCEMKQIDPDYCDMLKALSNSRSVQKALHSVLSVEENDEKHIQMIFDRVDADGDGFLTRDEVKQALLSVNCSEDVEELADEIMMHSGDNKKVSFKEFRDSMLEQMLLNDEFKIRAIFNALDENNDGFISPHEFVQCIPGAKVHDEGVQDIVQAFKDADENHDGLLSYDEFKTILSENDERTKSAFLVLQRQEVDEVINDNERYIQLSESEASMV